MTLILRCVDVSSLPIKIEEFFIEFLNVRETTGSALFDILVVAIESLGLDVDNIRGQGYDNGSNMSGKDKGVQKRLLNVNPRAFYMPCGCHSLNLVLCDMANSCVKVKSFFGACQCMYTVLCHSTKRWSVFLDCLDGLTLKSLCNTRWESHIESVKAIKSQVSQIKEALLKVADVIEDAKLSRDARLLATHELSSFEFLVSLVIWYDIWYNINAVSKFLQSENMQIDAAVEQLKGLVVFFDKYREQGFEFAINSAEEIALNMGKGYISRKTANIRKGQFDELANTDREPQTTKECFKTDYFLFVVDIALSELRSMFKQLDDFEKMFGFLLNGAKLLSLVESDLERYCENLESSLKKDDVSDVDAHDLFLELKFLREMLPPEAYSQNKPWTSVKILEFVVTMNIFPNVTIAYQILLTLPVTVATAERSFSKLKLLKNCLRTTMSQDRLNGLAVLCIEKDMFENITYDNVIDDFASKNARRMHLK